MIGILVCVEVRQERLCTLETHRSPVLFTDSVFYLNTRRHHNLAAAKDHNHQTWYWQPVNTGSYAPSGQVSIGVPGAEVLLLSDVVQ